MERIDIDAEISAHKKWRRQFLNAFAAGNYAAMPLSDHRSCMLASKLKESGVTAFPYLAALVLAHGHFHSLANDIADLSENALADEADMLLPKLTDASYQLLEMLDRLRDWQAA